MKIIITENQQNNLHKYLRRLDGFFYEYLQENWTPEDICDSPYGDLNLGTDKANEAISNFVERNMSHMASQFSIEMINLKGGNNIDGFYSLRQEYTTVRDILKQAGYEEKLKEYLYNTIKECNK